MILLSSVCASAHASVSQADKEGMQETAVAELSSELHAMMVSSLI